MADGALVLVDAAEGPMPQTRFVLTKALECRPEADRGHQQDRPPRRPAGRSARTRSSTCSWSWGPTTRCTISRTSSPAAARATPRTTPTCKGDSMQPAAGPGARGHSRPGGRRRTRRCRCWSRRSTGRSTSAASPSAASRRARIRKGQQVALMQADDQVTREQGAATVTSSTSWAAPRSKRPRRATSWPSSGWRTSRSATRSAIPSSSRGAAAAARR